MLKYVILIFQTLWYLLRIAYSLILLIGRCILCVILGFLNAGYVTIYTVAIGLNAIYEEVSLFFSDVNNKTTAVLEYIAEEATKPFSNVSEFTADILNELSNLTTCGKHQLQNISDAIALGFGWGARILNGALFVIGDSIWGTMRFVPHLLLMPLVLLYKLLINAVNLILLSLLKTIFALLRIPMQSLFGLAFTITIFKFRHRIYIFSRAVVRKLYNNFYQIWENRTTHRRSPGRVFVPIVERNPSSSAGINSAPVLRNRRNLTNLIYISTREILLQLYNNIYRILRNRRNRPAAILENSPRVPPGFTLVKACRCPSGKSRHSTDNKRQQSPIDANSFDNSCVICQEQLKCVVLLPCKHLCLCEQCSQQITLYQDTCPLCRICVKTKMTVYI